MSSPNPVADVLDLLRRRHNVLLSGPPGTGKSHLLTAVAAAFRGTGGGMKYTPDASIAIPPAAALPSYLPSPTRGDRETFFTAFYSGTTTRDVLRGLVPAVDPSGTHTRFEVSSGVLYRAAEHARTPDGAALLIIDEINRGPAVAAFASSIVALDSDKRLGPDGAPTATTQAFEILDDTGHAMTYALPTHLYILAAMNTVDTSVEALDVAFLRRLAPYRVGPQEHTARAHLGLPATAPAVLDPAPVTAEGMYELLVAAWKQVNRNLTLGRGRDYQLGHGALMPAMAPTSALGASTYAAQCFAAIRQHAAEVFFGDDRALAIVLAADTNSSPFTLTETTFADTPVTVLHGPDELDGQVLLDALGAIAAAGHPPAA